MVASNLVLIPGAGGVGRAVFEQLRAQDVPARFMVRREDERAAELKGIGAEVVIGDLTRPETVAAALQGVLLRRDAGRGHVGGPPRRRPQLAELRGRGRRGIPRAHLVRDPLPVLDA